MNLPEILTRHNITEAEFAEMMCYKNLHAYKTSSGQDRLAMRLERFYEATRSGGGIPYESLSDSFKESIESIDDHLNYMSGKGNTPVFTSTTSELLDQIAKTLGIIDEQKECVNYVFRNYWLDHDEVMQLTGVLPGCLTAFAICHGRCSTAHIKKQLKYRLIYNTILHPFLLEYAKMIGCEPKTEKP